MKLRSNASYGEHKQKVLKRIFVKNQKTKSTEPEERKRGESAKNSDNNGESIDNSSEAEIDQQAEPNHIIILK